MIKLCVVIEGILCSIYYLMQVEFLLLSSLPTLPSSRRHNIQNKEMKERGHKLFTSRSHLRNSMNVHKSGATERS